MKARLLFAFLAAFILLALRQLPVLADGIIVPPPCPADRCPPPPCRFDFCPPIPPRPISQLEIKYHRVTVKITDQVATTRVDQVFYNPNSWAVEGTYVFPLPVGAAVSNFKLWVDGQPVEGKVMEAEQARKYYEEIVRSLRDPALLEYIGKGAIQASIFPIPPQGERKIELEYNQVLTAENGLVHYVYPLNTEKFSQQPVEQVAVQVEIHDQQAIRAVYSPSHTVDVSRPDEHTALAGFEGSNILPDADFSLYYSLGDSEAFHLLTYRNPGDLAEPDGFFLLLLAPKPGEGSTPLPKDVIVVLDRSGSMEGEKFQQAQAALRYILKKLNPDDRFHLLAFSTGVEAYAEGMRPASEAPEALSWVDRLSSMGSTDINRALLEAASAAGNERPTYLIFLTDGLPTVGELDSQKILANFAQAAPKNLRLFTFGVGYDVDTFLLDSLSSEHHGLSTYVKPEDPLDEIVSSFYEKISTPVMTDLQIQFGGAAVYDIYPQPLPDLFAGNQAVVVGRYKAGGVMDVTLTGQVNGEPQKLVFPGQQFASDSRGQTGDLSSLPRLWATRKIGYLLNKIRLSGPDKESIDQIVKLSVRYGIVTPYTSYLVSEPMPLGASSQEKIAQDAYNQALAAPPEVSGQKAFNRAAQEGQMQSADAAPAAVQAQGTAIRVIGERTFIYQDGTWMDTQFDPQNMQPIDVPFLSDDYFKLAQTRPDLAAALALGEKVIVVVDGKAYRSGQSNQTSTPIPMPATAIPVEPTFTTASPTLTLPPVGSPSAVPPQNPAVCGGLFIPLGGVIGFWLFRMRKKEN